MLYCNSETLPYMRDDSKNSKVIDEKYDRELKDHFIALYKVTFPSLYPSPSLFLFLSFSFLYMVQESRNTMKAVQADMNDRSTNRYITVIVSTIAYDKQNNVSKYDLCPLSSPLPSPLSPLPFNNSVFFSSSPYRHVYMSLDKTKQRNAELELERYKDTLEHKVHQRTLEVQEKENQYASPLSSSSSFSPLFHLLPVPSLSPSLPLSLSYSQVEARDFKCAEHHPHSQHQGPSPVSRSKN